LRIVVFDTKVYISAFAAPGSKSSLALQLAARGIFELVVSPAILADLRRELSETKFGFSKRALDDADQDFGEMQLSWSRRLSSAYSETSRTTRCWSAPLPLERRSS
jgi:hypothetical protein